MHAIIIVHKPYTVSAEPEWNEFLNKFALIRKKFSATEVIQETIFQIDLTSGIDDLASILSLFVSQRLSYQVLMLKDNPTWLKK